MVEVSQLAEFPTMVQVASQIATWPWGTTLVPFPVVIVVPASIAEFGTKQLLLPAAFVDASIVPGRAFTTEVTRLEKSIFFTFDMFRFYFSSIGAVNFI